MRQSLRQGRSATLRRMTSGYLANQLLIAMPTLDDPNFARGVAVVCQHSADGAMGIVINRPAPISLGDVFAQLGIGTTDTSLSLAPVFVGGPVHQDRGFVLHDGGHRWASTLEVAPGLALTTSREILSDIAAGNGPPRMLLALGCAGWGSQQLESEIRDNAWLTAPAEAGLIFDAPVAERWQTASRLVGFDMTRIVGQAGRA